MQEKLSGGKRIESFIDAARISSNSPRLMLHPEYLDDENILEEERAKVLSEIFSRDIRKKELQALANHFAPLLDHKASSHAMIYGPTGSGKTTSIITFLESLERTAQRENTPIEWRLVELTAQSTCFAALNRIAVSLEASRTYFKGIPIELMQTRIRDNLADRRGTLILFLDEIDNIETDRDIFMSYLVKSLPRQVPVKLFYIFTSNRLDWEKTLDARIHSCLRSQTILFTPYNALEITEILKLRVQKALDPSRVDDSAINLISALASKHSGDARKAVELLSKSAMIAERNGSRLTIKEVEVAEKTLEVEKTILLAQNLPLHQKLCLAACYALFLRTKKRVHSGDVYEKYKELAVRMNLGPISQRRLSDIINSLDLYSLIRARIVSHGRYGKTREIENPVGTELAARTLDHLNRLLVYK